MSKRMTAIICTLALTLTLLPSLGIEAAAAAPQEVLYDLSKDAGVTDKADGEEIQWTDVLQNSGGKPVVVDYNGGKSIYVSEKTEDYNGMDIKREALRVDGAFVGGKYTFTVTGRIEAGKTAKVKLSQSGSPYSTYTLQTVDEPGGGFTLVYEADYSAKALEDLGLNFRVQTESAPDTKFYIDSIVVTLVRGAAEEPPVTPPPSGDAVTVYDLSGDTEVTEKADGAPFPQETTHLQKSGDASVTVKDFNGSKSLYVSDRVNNYDAIDIKPLSLDLKAGVQYTFTVKGHLDEDVVPPAGSSAVLGQAESPYGELKKVPLAKEFVLEYVVTYTNTDLADLARDNMRYRIQTDAAAKAVPYYVDSIVVTAVYGSEPEITELLRFTFDDKEGQESLFTTNGASAIEWVNEPGIGKDDDTALKGTNINKDNYTSADNAIRLTFNEPLPAGGVYNISVWFYAPAASNEGKGTLTGPGLVLNEGYAGSTGDTKFPANVGTMPLDEWKEVNINTTLQEFPLETIDFRFVVNSASNHPDVWYIDSIAISQVGDLEDVIIPEWDLKLPSLKETYEQFLIGNIMEPHETTNADTTAMFNHHYNTVTSENAMKPVYLSPSKGVYNLTNADRLVEWAEDNGIKVHGHTLVWHSQSSDWVYKDADGNPLTRAEAKENLEAYINNVAGHFKGKVISWDVVNEAFHGGTTDITDWRAGLRKQESTVQETAFWYLAYENGADKSKGESGADYIYDAFVFARLTDPDATLYYNDFNETEAWKREAMALMAEELNETWKTDPRNEEPDRLLVEGLGMQAHYWTDEFVRNASEVEATIKRFIEAGVKISISELDIPQGAYGAYRTDREAEQAVMYARLFKIFPKYASHIERITFWGKADPQSWRAPGNPTLFDRTFAAKEAYYAVISPEDYTDDAEQPIGTNQSTASFAAPVIDGTVDAVWSEAPELPVNRYQSARQGASGVAKVLWDNQNLYVLIQVSDAELDKSSTNAWEQDSVEIFLDQDNGKASSYKDGDGQYRINFDNETSFNPASIAEGFVSATKVYGTSYTVEAKIPFTKITPANGTEIGFDVQINDAKDGTRQSVATWNDTTGNGYQDPSVFGVLTLTGKPGSSSGNYIYIPPAEIIENKDGVVTIRPEVKTDNGRAKGTISGDNLKKALEQAAPAASGKKQIVIELPKQADAESYEVELPAQSLKGDEIFELVINTENASIQIPSNMLSNVTETEPVSIRVDKASADNLGAAARQQIGNRPVIGLSLVAGDNVIAWNNPDAPITAAIPYTPTGEELSNPDHIVVWYIDGNGNATAIPNGRYDAATEAVVFRTTHFSTYAVAYVFKTFGDLQSVPWAKQAIDAMASRDVIKGTAENSFSPEDSIKRADFIALLVRALELNGTGKNEATFSDVQKTDYYYDELEIAKELGIAKGYEDNTFKPNSNISRQDMMVLTVRALAAAGKQIEGSGALDGFPDHAGISDYAKESVAIMVKYGILDGKDGRIAPNDPLTRAEAAVILYRIWNL